MPSSCASVTTVAIYKFIMANTHAKNPYSLDETSEKVTLIKRTYLSTPLLQPRCWSHRLPS